MKFMIKKDLVRSTFLMASALAVQTAHAAVTINYNPIVQVVGGTNGTTGYTTSVDLFNNSQTGQTGLTAVATISYNGAGSVPDSRLVNTPATNGGNLNNNPALVNSAESGQSYTGTAYAYSAGFDAVTGTANVGETAANADRVVGAVSLGIGTLNSAAIVAHQSATNAYVGSSTINGSINGAVGDDSATNFWTAGAIATGATSNSGDFQYFNTPVKIGAGSSFIAKDVVDEGGYLFGDTQTGGLIVFNQSPPPTTPLAPAQLFSISSPNPGAFALLDNPNNPSSIYGINTAYVAVNGIGTTGIQKWVYNGTSWADAYTISGVAFYGLVGQYDPNSTDEILYATTTAGLYQIEDPLAATTNTSAISSRTLLATASSGTQFQGVALEPVAAVPEPASFLLLAISAAFGTVRRCQSPRRGAVG